MPKPIENTKRISTFVTPEQLSDLKVRAKSMGMTVSGYIRMLIVNGINTSVVSNDSSSEDNGASVDELFAQLSGEPY